MAHLLEGNSFMSETPFLDHPRFRSTDAVPIRMTGTELIDLQSVDAHIDKAIRLGRYQGSTDPIEYLIEKQCLVRVEQDLYPTLAGILCFGHDPQATFPNAVVDLGHYQGLEPVSFEVLHLEKNIRGTIFDQLQRVEEYLWRNTHHGMTLGTRGFERVEVHEYPQAVIREVGVNMLAHRDYMLLSASRVMLFRDRIEWHSPGGLPPGVTEENLLKAQSPRNPVVLSILHEAGWVEAFGQGLDTVVRVLRDAEMEPPHFEDIGAAFIVTINGRQPSSIEAGTYFQYSTAQQTILEFLRQRDEATFSEIRALIPGRGERTIQADIQSLVDANIIERIGQTKATRYRLRRST
jgi:predicted HTH transcriptional regulator